MDQEVHEEIGKLLRGSSSKEYGQALKLRGYHGLQSRMPTLLGEDVRLLAGDESEAPNAELVLPLLQIRAGDQRSSQTVLKKQKGAQHDLATTPDQGTWPTR